MGQHSPLAKTKKGEHKALTLERQITSRTERKKKKPDILQSDTVE